MKNYAKIPIKIEYENLNTKLIFDLPIIEIEKYIRNGSIYIQIISDDDTRPTVKERADIKIDKMTAKVTLNIPIEISLKYLRGEHCDFIYVKYINKLTTEDLR